jgi:DNA-binding beta-propeller fold protein YncE
MNRYLAICLLAVLVLGGSCSEQPGVLFAPPEQPVVWPPPPDAPRIRYVGQLASNEDLKPGRSSWERIGQTLFGKPDRHGMSIPFAVCTDGVSRVFAADKERHVVHVFDLNTRRYAQWTPPDEQPPLQQPVGIAWDPSGRLLVSDSAAAVIHIFDRNGRYQGVIGKGLLQRPCGLRVEAQTSRIFVADSAAHQVVCLSAAGKEEQRIGRRGVEPGEFNFPIDVALDHKGKLYVADALNFRVQQFAPDRKSIRIIGKHGDQPGSFAQPKCLDVDSEDHVYVIDNRFEAVQIFDSDGRLLLNFGREGHGPGEFWLPTGIFIDPRNRIWIADSYNHRIQAFDYLPETP